MTNKIKSFVRVPKRDSVIATFYGLYCKDKFIAYYNTKLEVYSEMDFIIFHDKSILLTDFSLFKVQPIKI